MNAQAQVKDMGFEPQAVLEVSNLSKSFPGVRALDKVSFSAYRGEVHCLAGENGAGKSTLMKVLAGMYRPDEGAIFFQGEKVNFRNPMDAIKKGVNLIHQELSLVPELSVAENIFLGRLPLKKGGIVDKKVLAEKTRKILDRLGCHFRDDELVGNLSIGCQQLVEIARALSHDPQVVIFDEPTASLTEAEVEILFRNIRALKKQGAAIIYITHKMDEIFEIADHISVLRDGKRTGTRRISETNQAEVINLMIGRDLSDFFAKTEKQIGKEVLRVEGLSRDGLVKNVSFSVKTGEVLGLYGLIGAGRSETVEAIFGVVRPDSGKIFIDGKESRIESPKQAVELGMGFVPEDRKGQGLVLGMTCAENLSLVKLPQLRRFGLIQNKKERELFDEYAKKLSISTTGPGQKVVKLSGGNQQKIVISKWMAVSPKILILDEPTRGIDVGSKSEIHKLVGKMAKEGMAVIVISSEMPEIMGVCDRIITMAEGRITGEFTGDKITEKNLMHAISQR
jgi:ABC-type sugar transport system ATPase subunit